MWLNRLSIIPQLLKKIEWLNVTWLLGLVGLGIGLVFRIWQHAWTLPLVYTGDSLFSLMIIKNLVINHSLTINPNLGFPFHQNLVDFPLFEGWHWLWVWLISLFTTNIFIIQNVFFFSTFFSIALSSYYVMRRLKITVILAGVGALIFTFLPFHLLSNTNHLFLSDYASIPLAILFTLELATNQSVSLLPRSVSLFKKKYLLTAIALIMAGSGIYYAVFSLFFIGVGLLFSLFKYRNFALSKKALYVIIIIVLGLIVQLAPTIKFHRQYGVNHNALTRLPLEAELYSLKFNQLVLPLSVLQFFHFSGKLKGEGTEYLGIVGVLGLVIILSWPIINKYFDQKTNLIIKRLSYLSFIAILLSISTGVGTLIAYAFTSQIRAYTRISPFLAFMCITAFLLAVQQWFEKLKIKAHQNIFIAILVVITAISLVDQTGWYSPTTSIIQSSFTSDQNLIHQIEVSIPADSAIFQLPYKAFPESVSINQLNDYDLLKPYLHSQNISWSYAGIKGRPGDEWYQQTATQSASQLITTIKQQGFSGILINRDGYQDHGQAIEASLSAIIKTEPLASEDKTSIFYLLK